MSKTNQTDLIQTDKKWIDLDWIQSLNKMDRVFIQSLFKPIANSEHPWPKPTSGGVCCIPLKISCAPHSEGSILFGSLELNSYDFFRLYE